MAQRASLTAGWSALIPQPVSLLTGDAASAGLTLSSWPSSVSAVGLRLHALDGGIGARQPILIPYNKARSDRSSGLPTSCMRSHVLEHAEVIENHCIQQIEAGVDPASVARDFGISRDDVDYALAFEATRRER